jgi:hypothetical protein
MIDHDRLFKELLRTFFVEFLDLFLPAVRAYLDPESLVFLDKEVLSDITVGERYETDLVVQAHFRGEPSCFLIHVEHQAQAEAEFGRRMFRYVARLHERHGLPVYPVVVFSYDTPQREEPSVYRVVFPNKVVLAFNYDVIQLNQLHWRECIRHRNPVACAVMAKMQIVPEERPRVKLECLRLLTTLRLDPARMTVIGVFMDTYVRLSADEERVFQEAFTTIQPTEQEGVMELMTSWEEKGVQRGRQEGRHEEGVTILLRQLTRRVGPLPPDLEARLRRLSLAE